MNVFQPASIRAPHRQILGLPICDFTWENALAFADEVASLPIGQTVISFMNAHNANLMMRDHDYRNVLQRHTVLPDGYGIDIASWLFHGAFFPANLNGTDFVPALMTYMVKPRRIALLGAAPDVVQRAAEHFRKHAPWHEFVVVADGYFDESESENVLERVRDLKPDILLVAMGTPMQEKWIDRHVGPSHARLVISVGALFDFMAGTVSRASPAIRRLRLEWLHRLVLEPRRLWRRYLLGIPLFLRHVIMYKLTAASPQPRDPRSR